MVGGQEGWRHPRQNWSKQADYWLFEWDASWESKAQERDAFRRRFQSWLRFCRRKWRGPQMVEVGMGSWLEGRKKPNVKTELFRIQKFEDKRGDKRSLCR